MLTACNVKIFTEIYMCYELDLNNFVSENQNFRRVMSQYVTFFVSICWPVLSGVIVGRMGFLDKILKLKEKLVLACALLLRRQCNIAL